MRLTMPLPDGLHTLHIEVYYPDDRTLFSKTEAMAGLREVRVKLPADPSECLIRVFPVQNSEPVSNGYVFKESQLRPYRPLEELRVLSPASEDITDESVESVESVEPPAAIMDGPMGPSLQMAETLELSSSPSLVVVTNDGIKPLEDEEPADKIQQQDEPDE